MKKAIVLASALALVFSLGVNAQEKAPKQKKKAKTEKACAPDAKKSCDKEKKAGCCSSKK